MKKTILTLPFVAIAATASAGDYYPMPTSKQVIAEPECKLQWFLGASAGYLTDYEEDMYHLQFGADRICQSACGYHSVYLEVGFTETDENFGQVVFGNTTVDLSADAEIIPLTLNWKYTSHLIDNFNWYFGAGAGVAFTDLSVSAGSSSLSDDDTTFYAQIFTGLSYNFSQNVELFGGARYIFMDDADLTGFSEVDDLASIDEEILLELGLRIKF